ncbi:hypothetical protein FOL46_001239, partial [Perkinsus olseni]
MPCVSSYKGQYSWLRIRKVDGGYEYCCGECMDHRASGKWSDWRRCQPLKFKKSDLDDHQKSIDSKSKHRFGALPVDIAFKKIAEKQKVTEADRLASELALVAPLADLAMTLAIEEVPILKTECMLQWAERHGLEVTKHWRSLNCGWEFVKVAHAIQ